MASITDTYSFSPRSDYLGDHDLWPMCQSPESIVPWNLTLFSLLLIMSGIQLVLCAIQAINGLFGALCGDCKCCGCCGVRMLSYSSMPASHFCVDVLLFTYCIFLNTCGKLTRRQFLFEYQKRLSGGKFRLTVESMKLKASPSLGISTRG